MAQEAETKVVTFDGEEYTVPKYVLEDLDALEAFEDRQYTHFAKAVLGREQYATFRKTHSDSTSLFNLANALLGGDDEETEDKE